MKKGITEEPFADLESFLMTLQVRLVKLSGEIRHCRKSCLPRLSRLQIDLQQLLESGYHVMMPMAARDESPVIKAGTVVELQFKMQDQ
jgi:hypothetical protein